LEGKMGDLCFRSKSESGILQLFRTIRGIKKYAHIPGGPSSVLENIRIHHLSMGFTDELVPDKSGSAPQELEGPAESGMLVFFN
jgi:hypothetical protein